MYYPLGVYRSSATDKTQAIVLVALSRNSRAGGDTQILWWVLLIGTSLVSQPSLSTHPPPPEHTHTHSPFPTPKTYDPNDPCHCSTQKDLFSTTWHICRGYGVQCLVTKQRKPLPFRPSSLFKRSHYHFITDLTAFQASSSLTHTALLVVIGRKSPIQRVCGRAKGGGVLWRFREEQKRFYWTLAACWSGSRHNSGSISLAFCDQRVITGFG